MENQDGKDKKDCRGSHLPDKIKVEGFLKKLSITVWSLCTDTIDTLLNSRLVH